MAAAACALGAEPAVAGGTLTRVDAHVVAGFQQVAGPAFAGSGFAWATPSASEGGYDVSVLRDGTLVTRHVAGPGADPNAYGDQVTVALAASADAVAFAIDVQRCGDESACKYQFYEQVRSDSFAGPIGGQFSRLGCGGGGSGGYYSYESVDLEGPVIASYDTCAGGAVVRDLTAAQDSSWRVFPMLNQLRSAGSYLAVNSQPQSTSGNEPVNIVVYDWRSGEKLYTADPPPDGIGQFDVRDDGTVAFMGPRGSGQPSELDWASREEPSAHRIAQVGAAQGDVRIAGTRVAVRAGGKFQVFDLDGRAVASASARDAVGNFDFDGQRLVFAAQPCQALAIVMWDLAGAPPALAAGRCPHAFLAGTTGAVNLRHRTIRIPVRCPSTPALGCSGDWYVEPRPRVSGYSYSQRVALGPGERRSISFRLFRTDACAIERGQVRRVVVHLGTSYTRRHGAPGRPGILSRVRTVGRARGCRR